MFKNNQNVSVKIAGYFPIHFCKQRKKKWKIGKLLQHFFFDSQYTLQLSVSKAYKKAGFHLAVGSLKAMLYYFDKQHRKSQSSESFKHKLTIQIIMMAWMLYILTSIWVLRTPNAGRNRHFQHFSAKKLKKKQKICSKFQQK